MWFIEVKNKLTENYDTIKIIDQFQFLIGKKFSYIPIINFIENKKIIVFRVYIYILLIFMFYYDS